MTEFKSFQTFHLQKENLPPRDLPKGLKVSETNDPYVIGTCINMFNQDLEWDGMFNVFDAMRRIGDGEKIYIATINGDLFGYCWVEKQEENRYYIYNVFSKKTYFPRQYGATDMLHYVIANHTEGVIWVKIDDWNEKSIRVFEKLGFQRID